MLNKLVIFILILCSFIANAQTDIYYNRSKSIPSSGTNSGFSTGSSLSLPSITKDPKLPSTSYQKPSFMTEQPKDIGFTLKKETFVNPGDKVREKINSQIREGQNADISLFTRNMSFGDLRTKSATVVIKCRDHSMIDGDMIKIKNNDQVIKGEVYLGYEYRHVSIALEQGFNKIDFQALNVGTSLPNTAEFQIFDDKGLLLLHEYWGLATGFNASVVIIKE